MKGFLILFGDMAKNLADKNLFAACVPMVQISTKANFNAFFALHEFLAALKSDKGPLTEGTPEIEVFSPDSDYLKVRVRLVGGEFVEIKVVPVWLETS